MASAGRIAFDMTFEISPIILVGGIAGAVPGAAVPILNYLQPGIFPSLIDSGGGDLTLDQFFAHFRPLPGSTLAENLIGEYPFANQTVAANAIIIQPLHVSLLMVCPVNPPNTYAQKYSIMTALQATLAQHDIMGGLYTVATPSFIYQNCIRLRLVEVSRGESQQPQTTWQWDFRQPLVAVQGVQQTYNNMMGKIAAQTPLGPNASGQIPTSGIPSSVGVDTSGSITQNAIPSSAPLGGIAAPTDTGASSTFSTPSGSFISSDFSSAPVPTTP